MDKAVFYFGFLCHLIVGKWRGVKNKWVVIWRAGYNARTGFFKTASVSVLYSLYAGDYEKYCELTNAGDLAKFRERKKRGIVIDWEAVHLRAGKPFDMTKFASKAS